MNASKVTIKAIYIDGEKLAGSRRLADAVVKVEWSVKANKAIDAKAMVPATLKANAQDALTAAGVAVEITSDPVTSIVPATTPALTVPLETSGSATKSVVAGTVLAFATLLSLAEA